MKIICVPLEDIEQRYTKMMNAVLKPMVDVWVYPEWKLSDTIESGQFLDINKTCIFKSKQLQMIAEMFYQNEVQDGDVFFIADIFFPGIESIKYMAELNNISVKVYGINHAGRADFDDFVRKLKDWSDISELAWHRICDGIFVGSNFHGDKVSKYFNIPREKIHATGQVWSLDYVYSLRDCDDKDKEDFVIFPHRVCKEKGIDSLLLYAMTTKKRIVITSSGTQPIDIELPDNVIYINGLSKQTYYRIMSRARWYLSTAHQETFGYTLQEAIAFGCIVAVPNRACYSEMIGEEYIFDNLGDVDRIFESCSPPDKSYTSKWNDSAKHMIQIMRGDK